MNSTELRQEAERVICLRRKNKIINLFKALSELLDENIPDDFFITTEDDIENMMAEIEGDISQDALCAQMGEEDNNITNEEGNE